MPVVEPFVRLQVVLHGFGVDAQEERKVGVQKKDESTDQSSPTLAAAMPMPSRAR